MTDSSGCQLSPSEWTLIRDVPVPKRPGGRYYRSALPFGAWGIMNDHGPRGAAHRLRTAAPLLCFACLATLMLAAAALVPALVAPAAAQPLPGELLWARTYAGPQHLDDVAADVAVGPDGSVYIAGTRDGGGASEAGQIIRIARYSAGGALIWQRFYAAKANTSESPAAIAVDRYGDAFVVGSRTDGTGSDLLLLRYDKTGRLKWVRSHRGPADGDSEGADVAVDGRGDCYVTGQATRALSSSDLLVARYTRAGVLRWTRYWTNPTVNGPDYGVSIAVTPGGRSVVSGDTRINLVKHSWVTVAFDRTGKRLWSHTFGTRGAVDNRADQVVIAKDGSVYVSGTVVVEGKREAAVVRYGVKGALKWWHMYWGDKASCDWNAKVAVDQQGDAILAATTIRAGLGYGWAVMKLSPQGDHVWLSEVDDAGSPDEVVTAVATDADGTVFVAGDVGTAEATDAACAGFSAADGTRIWFTTYDDPAHGIDLASALAVESGAGVFLAGSASNEEGDADMLLASFQP